MVDVFISWSKPTSHEFAKILYRWLPEVIQELNPWLSSEDIDKGARWAVELGENIPKFTESIICVTPDNFDEPWLNFEAGALAQSIEASRVRPVMFNVDASVVAGGPLAQFQATVATERTEMSKLLKSLDKACQRPLGDERLQRAFKKHWKDFLEAVHNVELASAGPNSVHRRAPHGDTLTQMVREIHETLLSGQLAPAASAVPQKLPPPPGFEPAVFPPEVTPRPTQEPYAEPAARGTSTDHVLADTSPRRPERRTPVSQPVADEPSWPTVPGWNGQEPSSGQTTRHSNETDRPRLEPGDGQQYVTGA